MIPYQPILQTYSVVVHGDPWEAQTHVIKVDQPGNHSPELKDQLVISSN
jgi:hypothetical protein